MCVLSVVAVVVLRKIYVVCAVCTFVPTKQLHVRVCNWLSGYSSYPDIHNNLSFRIATWQYSGKLISGVLL